MIDKVDTTGYDFLDFGSGFGGCIKFAKKRLGGSKVLGFEHHAGRCADLNKNGIKCVNADITKLSLSEKSVSYITISHVLEHLKNREDVKKVLQLAITTAKDFVYVEGPAFAFDDFLDNLNLKFMWRDGHGHFTKVTLPDIIEYASTLGIAGYTTLIERPLIADSTSKDIHSVSSPPDVTAYEKDVHPPKDFIVFNIPIYRSFIVFLWLHTKIDTYKYMTSRAKFRKRTEKWLK